MATSKPVIRVELHSDQDSESPRHWDNLGVMVCAHRCYSLGDDDGARKALDLVRECFSSDQLDAMGFDPEHIPDLEALLEKSGQAIILPLYLYDHGGITMKTTPFSCRWDSGQVGFIFVSKEKVRREYDWKRINSARTSQIHKLLEGEVEVYDQYLRGDVWGFKVFKDDEEADSCWGFYGDNPLSNGVIDHLCVQAKALVAAGDFQRIY